MTTHDRDLTRRRFLGAGAAFAGGLAFAGSSRATNAASRSGTGLSWAAAQGQQLAGQIVIAIKTNPSEAAKQALTAAYQAQQPNVDIVWETQEMSGADYSTFLGTQLAAGDIRLDVVSANYLETFDGYVNLERYRNTTNPYTGRSWAEELMWEKGGFNSLGERTVFSTREARIGWFYNQDMFAEAGVVPPTNWTEFIDVCTTLDDAGFTPIVSNFDWMIPQWISEIYFDQYHVDWVETIRSQPGDWNYNPDRDDSFVFDATNPDLHNSFTYSPQRFWGAIRDGAITVDTPAVAEIVRNMSAVFPRFATGDFFVMGDPYPAFLQQQAAMMVDGSYNLNPLKADLESLTPERLEKLGIDASSVSTFEWDVFPIVPMDGPLVKGPARGVEGGSGEYISAIEKASEQTELVVDFVRFWLSTAGYEPYLAAAAAAPGFAVSGPSRIVGVEDAPEWQELFEMMPAIGNAEQDYYQVWTSGVSGDPTSRQDLRNLFKDALEETITPEEYGSRLQAYFTDNLDTLLELSGLTAADLDNPARQPGT